MTQLFREVEKTSVTTEWCGTKCDGCGYENKYGAYFVHVVIAVHEGEEMGGADEYDYCDDCILEKAPFLVAAGSTAPIVAGEKP